MGKYIQLKKPADYGLHVLLFCYVAFWNAVMLTFSHPLEQLGYRGWAFFFVNILFFVFPEKDIPAKMVKLAVGAVTGCLLAWAVIMLYIGPLAGWGVVGLIVPILTAVGSIFLVGPFVPLCFNVATFAYFTAALVNAEDAVVNVVPNMVWAVLGVLICDGGYALILKAYKKYRAQKSPAEGRS